MKLIKRYAWIVAVAAPLVALAHEGGQHFMGTVRKIDEKELTLQTKEKKEIKVRFDEKTKFEKGGSASSAKEVSVGERVVVHTAKSEGTGTPVAVLVKIGAAPKAPANSTPAHEHHSPGK